MLRTEWKKQILLISFTLISLISKNEAENLVIKKFNQTWYEKDDGCGKFNKNTGRIEPNIIASKKALFGYKIDIEYLCGFVHPSQKPERKSVFVISFGKVYEIKE